MAYKSLQFQRVAIDELKDTFIKLWHNPARQIPLVFKSPTGSGKTFMTTKFIDELNYLPNWDYDKCFVWVTFNDELAMQSKQKFYDYLFPNFLNAQLTFDDFKKGILNRNDILFINWQKLVSNKAEDRKLRRPDDERLLKEQGFYFDDVIENTKKQNREIILIIDESHTHLSDLAQRTVIDVLDPKITLHISATPTFEPTHSEIRHNRAGYVEVEHSEVVAQGLIKEKVVLQTEEDLKAISAGEDLDGVLLDLAIAKRKEIIEEYQKLGKKINPLVLVQLPNDDKELAARGESTKEEVVTTKLVNKGIALNKIGKWFDKHPRPEFIEHPEDEHEFLLFKMAAGTGWDCPRAHILVMYREIDSPTFKAQTIGRILRMPDPEAKEVYKNSPIISTGFLFTNYKKNDISNEEWNKTTPNKPFTQSTQIKDGIENVVGMTTDFISRVDYGDFADAAKFQMSFVASMDSFFGLSENSMINECQEKIKEKGVDLSGKVNNQIIVNAIIKDFDKINLELAKSGTDIEIDASIHDVEKTFNFLCFEVLKEQTDDETKVTNFARSYATLKRAVRIWFQNRLSKDSNYYYRVFINDIKKEQASILRQAIHAAIKEFYPVRKEILDKRKKDEERRSASIFTIQNEYQFTEDYEAIKVKLCALQECYLLKNYDGKKNELPFIEYLEQKGKYIDWWFKNGTDKSSFGLKYFNTADNKDALFYPDFIIKFKNGMIGIFDTKDGFTAKHPEGRAEGLVRKIKEMNEAVGKEIFFGGLVTTENNQYYYWSDKKTLLKTTINSVFAEEPIEYSKTLKYEYTKGNLNSNWFMFNELFK
jgi:type III restriction enzyme